MSYTPITWTDKDTVVEEEHMNEMEQALKSLSQLVHENETISGNLACGGYLTSERTECDFFIPIPESFGTISNIEIKNMTVRQSGVYIVQDLIPNSITFSQDAVSTRIAAVFDTLTTATNNDVIGISVQFEVTFS